MTTVLLDGGMGTALLDAGLPPGTLPERWLIDRPAEVMRVHRAHAAAGAEVLLTCTFNAAAPRLEGSGVEAGPEELARRALELARAAAPAARVAGAVGPTLLAGVVDASELRERYGRIYSALAAAGADLLWVESQWDLAEARAALAAARATGKPSVATFSFREQSGELLAGSGEPGLECLVAVAAEGAVAVGVNCMLPGDPIGPLLRRAAERVKVPLVAKPSAGLPGSVAPPDVFARWIGDLARAGASWLGGCCGATEAHLAACARTLGAL